MPHFIVIGKDAPNTLEKRMASRPAHVERLKVLHANGQIVAAGFMPTNSLDAADGIIGSTLIVDFATRSALDVWLRDEPYVLEGVYESVEVYPYTLVLSKN